MKLIENSYWKNPDYSDSTISNIKVNMINKQYFPIQFVAGFELFMSILSLFHICLIFKGSQDSQLRVFP